MIPSANAQEYLEAIYHLGGHSQPVRLADLAAELGLSIPSVNEMVRRLAEQNFVEYVPYKGVQLSNQGRCEALGVIRRHRLWERFLTDMLGLPWDQVHEAACRLEHAAEEEITERLAELLGHPQRCPHGHPVPPPDCGPIPTSQAVPLTSLAPQNQGRIAYIDREDADLLRYLESLGLLPDTPIVIQEMAPFQGPIKLGIEGETQVIGYNVAQWIYIIQGEHS